MIRWLAYISSLSSLIPVLSAAYQYNHLSKPLKLLAQLLVFGALVEGVNFILSHYKQNNLWLFNLYSITEGFVFCYLMGRWSDSKRMFIVSISLFFLYLLYWLYSTFIGGSLFGFNSHEKTIKGLMLIFLSGSLLIRISMDESIIMLSDYRFWITSAILIYFSVTLIVFSTATFGFEDHHRAMNYSWVIHSVINIISNLLFAYGFVWHYRKMNSFI